MDAEEARELSRESNLRQNESEIHRFTRYIDALIEHQALYGKYNVKLDSMFYQNDKKASPNADMYKSSLTANKPEYPDQHEFKLICQHYTDKGFDVVCARLMNLKERINSCVISWQA